MAANMLEDKAHELLGQLGPSQLAVVVQLLKVLVHDEADELTENDKGAITASREYFIQGGQGLSFEQVVAENGFTVDQIRGAKSD
jgi:hypothetical protein